MLGFAPLAALPLAAVQPALIVAVPTYGSAAGAVTFSGSAHAGVRLPGSATGSLTFGGSATPTIHVLRSASGSVTFGGSALLRLAGKPLVFTAVTERFEFSADGADYSFTSLTTPYVFRGSK